MEQINFFDLTSKNNQIIIWIYWSHIAILKCCKKLNSIWKCFQKVQRTVQIIHKFAPAAPALTCSITSTTESAWSPTVIPALAQSLTIPLLNPFFSCGNPGRFREAFFPGAEDWPCIKCFRFSFKDYRSRAEGRGKTLAETVSTLRVFMNTSWIHNMKRKESRKAWLVSYMGNMWY